MGETIKLSASDFQKYVKKNGKSLVLSDEYKEKPKSKYRNKKVEVDGEIYDSTSEKKYSDHLETQKKFGLIHRYDKQVKLYFYCKGKKMFHLKLDFVVYLLDGTIDYLDNKGWDKKKDKAYTLPMYRMKKKLIERQRGIVIKEVNPSHAIYYTKPEVIKEEAPSPELFFPDIVE